MRPSRVPEWVRYDPKSFDLPDLMLDPDTKPAQPLVVFLFVLAQFAAFGLLVGIIDGFVVLVVALTGAVAGCPALVGNFGPERRTARSWRLPGWDGETLAMRPFFVMIYSLFSVWRFFLPE